MSDAKLTPDILDFDKRVWDLNERLGAAIAGLVKPEETGSVLIAALCLGIGKLVASAPAHQHEKLLDLTETVIRGEYRMRFYGEGVGRLGD